ncbi:hypothetical protein [Rhizobium sp. RU20A]|uniref:hypothetical protein n=1 Tax=Rhizobium sp. RU20A TaxID=1907412 RepID=UPI00122CFF72|nr:hypothetical protein [Rhizobium sp. RU20A]
MDVHSPKVHDFSIGSSLAPPEMTVEKIFFKAGGANDVALSTSSWNESLNKFHHFNSLDGKPDRVRRSLAKHLDHDKTMDLFIYFKKENFFHIAIKFGDGWLRSKMQDRGKGRLPKGSATNR